MKQKRDANGKFVKMYLTREEYEKKVVELENRVNTLAREAQDSKNESSFWKQEYGQLKHQNEELQEMVTSLEIVKYWFLKHCGPILRCRFYKAEKKGEV